MTTHTRLNTALQRLASGTSVLRTRTYDADRAERNGAGRDARIEEAVSKLEAAADDLWVALDLGIVDEVHSHS